MALSSYRWVECKQLGIPIIYTKAESVVYRQAHQLTPVTICNVRYRAASELPLFAEAYGKVMRAADYC